MEAGMNVLRSRAPSAAGTPAARARDFADKRGTPQSHLRAQIIGGVHDVSTVIPEDMSNLVGPHQWDSSSVGTTRAGSTRRPFAPTTPRHLMQPTVADASPSPMVVGPTSPVRGGGILEQRTGIAGPSAAGFSPIVHPPQASDDGWDNDLLRPPHEDAAGGSGWGFEAQAPAHGAASDWGDWPPPGEAHEHAPPLSWGNEPPPLAPVPGLGSPRRASDASMYVQPHPSRPPSASGLRPPSAPHSRANSAHSSRGSRQGSAQGSPRRSPLVPAAEPPRSTFSPTLSAMHGADMFHTAVAPTGSPLPPFAPEPPPLGSPHPSLKSAIVSSKPPSPGHALPNPSPTRPSPSRSGRAPYSRPGTARPTRTPIIARDYALPANARVVNVDSSGTPRFLPVRPPAGVPAAASALREVLVAVDPTGPRHPDAASMAASAAEPEPELPAAEPEPPLAEQDAGPSAPGGGGFLGRMGSLFGGKKKPTGPRKVKKKKGKGAVEEMLGEELADAPADDGAAVDAQQAVADREAARKADEERKQREEEEARQRAEDEAMRLAAEEARRRVMEEREREEEARRDEEAARARAEAVDEATSALQSPQHEHADPPADEGAKKGWFGLGRKLTKKRKGGKGKEPSPSPPPRSPDPFILPDRASERTLTDAPGTVHAPTLLEFAGPPGSEEREFVVVPPPPDPHRAISVPISTPPQDDRGRPQQRYPPSQSGMGPVSVAAWQQAQYGAAREPTPRVASTYALPYANARGPGPAQHHVRSASGHSGALNFQLPTHVPLSAHGRTASDPNTASPARPSPSKYASAPPRAPGEPAYGAELHAEHVRVLSTLNGAEALREKAFLNNEERRARLFDEAEDRRRAEAEARRRVIEVWV